MNHKNQVKGIYNERGLPLQEPNSRLLIAIGKVYETKT
jgi:hypothetical protein